MSIYVYEERGRCPFYDWMRNIQHKNSAMYYKMFDILQQMEDNQLQLAPPQVKKMLARSKYRNLYKMRLGNYRLFFLWENHHYYLLHAFEKTSQTTPEKEVKQVEKEIRRGSYLPLERKKLFT